MTELIPYIKSGHLLAQVVMTLTQVQIDISIRPRTKLAAIGNIRKSLEFIRKLPKMS